MTACIDCGRPGGADSVRCRRCHGEEMRLQAARALAESDCELLRLKAVGLPNTRIAVRFGVSPVAVGQRLKRARRRQALLEEQK